MLTSQQTPNRTLHKYNQFGFVQCTLILTLNEQLNQSLSFASGSTQILPVSSSSEKAQTSNFEVCTSPHFNCT